jgi:hypothetical protein
MPSAITRQATGSRSHLALVACIGMSLSATALPAGAAPTIDDIRQGVRDAEGQIKNFSVTIRRETAARPFQGDRFGAMSQKIECTIICTFDHGGRFKYDIRGPVLQSNGAVSPPVFWRGSYDGSTHKEETGEERPIRGTVSSQPRPVSWGFDPQDLFYTMLGERIATTLEQTGCRVTGEETFEGRKVVAVETAPRTGVDKLRRKYRLIVDPVRGFAAVRREALQQLLGRDEWVVYYAQEVGSHEQLGSGVWVPTRASVKTFVVPDGKPAELLSETTAVISESTLNAALPEGFFETRFPSGLVIKDLDSGNTMVVARADEHPLDSAVTKGLEVYNETAAPKPFPVGYAVAAGVALLALILGIVVRRRRRAAA